MPGSQKFWPNFHWAILLNFLMVFDISLEMQSDSKNYVKIKISDSGVKQTEMIERKNTQFSIYVIN